MVKAALYFFLFFIYSTVNATTYYVDNKLGADTNNGTNVSTPWATVAKVNRTYLVPGDQVLFKAGNTWSETLIPASSGLPSDFITFGRYGTGPNPIFSGFNTLTSWTNNGDGTWSCIDNSLGATLNMVTINGAQQPIGRFPKAGYNTYTAHSNNTSITDSKLSASSSFVGAEVVIRKQHWIIDRATVISQSGGVIDYKDDSNTSYYTPYDGFGYFFQNHKSCLSDLGDWYYSPSTHKITMYFGSATPSSYNIKASKLKSLIYFSAARNCLKFADLDIEGANSDGVEALLFSSTFITFNNVTINNIGVNGFNFINANSVLVQNSTISNCNNNGFYNHTGSNNRIVKSNINNIHTIAGMGQSGDGNGMGIYMSGLDPAYNFGNSVTLCKLTNCGYTGINLEGDTFKIDSNFIDTYGFIKDDGAAIYSYTGKSPYKYGDRKILNNIIVNGMGASAGTVIPNTSGIHGIYLDGGSNHVTVSNNSISNCEGAGINVNESNNCTFTNNTVFNTGKNGWSQGQARFSLLNTTGQNMYAINFTDNILVADSNNQMMVVLNNTNPGAVLQDFSKWGTFDNNSFLAPPSSEFLFSHYIGSDPYPGYVISFKSWKSVLGLEKNSTLAFSPNTQKGNYSLGTNILKMPFSLLAHINLGSAAGTIMSVVNGTRTWETGLLDGGSLLVQQTNPKIETSLNINCGTISPTRQYLLTFSSKASFEGGIQVFLNSEYMEERAMFSYVAVDTTKKDHVVLLNTPVTNTKDYLIFRILPTYPGSIRLDNIVLSEVSLIK